MGISAIRHSCEHLRSHARSLNPLPRGVLIRSDANSLWRQRDPWMRTLTTPAVSDPFTATIARKPANRFRTSRTTFPARYTDRAHDDAFPLADLRLLRSTPGFAWGRYSALDYRISTTPTAVLVRKVIPMINGTSRACTGQHQHDSGRAIYPLKAGILQCAARASARAPPKATPGNPCRP